MNIQVGFAQTAAASMIFTCKYVLVCIISILRLCTEAVAGEVHGPNHSTLIFSYTHCKDAAAAIFWGEGSSRSHFLCLFEFFFLRGGTPETSGSTLGRSEAPKVTFSMHFGYPWGPLWHTLGILGQPGVDSGSPFSRQGFPKDEKMDTTSRKWL